VWSGFLSGGGLVAVPMLAKAWMPICIGMTGLLGLRHHDGYKAVLTTGE
jgi:hypothetical protein